MQKWEKKGGKKKKCMGKKLRKSEREVIKKKKTQPNTHPSKHIHTPEDEGEGK